MCMCMASPVAKYGGIPALVEPFVAFLDQTSLLQLQRACLALSEALVGMTLLQPVQKH